MVPTTLKKVVSQYAPMFAGHQQHDASELMSFLLDGIHEDLNRVHKKVFTDHIAVSLCRRKFWSSVEEGCHGAIRAGVLTLWQGVLVVGAFLLS